MHIFHLRSALPFAAICHERWVFLPGTTRRCQTTNTNDLTSGRLAVPVIVSHDSAVFISPGNSPPCTRLWFLLRASHRVERRFASALFSCSLIFKLFFYLRVRFFNLFNHRSVASSKRLQPPPVRDPLFFNISPVQVLISGLHDERSPGFLAHELSSLIIRHWTFWTLHSFIDFGIYLCTCICFLSELCLPLLAGIFIIISLQWKNYNL